MKRSVKTLCVVISAVLSLQMCIIAPVPELNANVSAASVSIDENNFPDEIFRNYVYSNFDQNKDHKLSSSEINMVQEIYVDSMGITSLVGVEYFANLSVLYCKGNALSSLDISANTKLTTLVCSNNSITELDSSNNTLLSALDCRNNRIEELSLDNNQELVGVDCSYNQLKDLDLSHNYKLYMLRCNNNHISSLDFSNSQQLSVLNANDNCLTELDASKNTSLTSLECNDNSISNLIVSSTLISKICCSHNELSMIDISHCTGLKYLECSNNYMTELDIRGISEIRTIDCGDNQITELELNDKYALVNLICNNNMLVSLDIDNSTELEKLDCSSNQLTSLSVRNNEKLYELRCNNNFLSSIDLSNNADIRMLDCSCNQIKRLNVSGRVHLEKLICHENLISELNLSGLSTILIAYQFGTAHTYEGTTPYTDYHYMARDLHLSVDNNVRISPAVRATSIPTPSVTNEPSPSVDHDLEVAIDETHFPNSTFRYQIGDYDVDGDGYLSDDEIAEVKQLYVNSSYINDLTGIQYFTSLEELGGMSHIDNLDLSGCDNLKSIYISATNVDLCDCSNLESVYLTNVESINLDNCSSIKSISCYGTYTSINLSDCTALESLDICGNNTDLDISGLCNLKEVRCECSELVTLDAHDCTGLVTLNCNDNKLSTLDAHDCIGLVTLNCNDNKLSTINLSGCISLKRLDCTNNELSELDVSGCSNLEGIDCSNNSISTIDLSGCYNLLELACNDNVLTDMDISDCEYLYRLVCYNNSLVELSLENNPKLNSVVISGFKQSDWNENGPDYYYSEDDGNGAAYLAVDPTVLLIPSRQNDINNTDAIKIDESTFPDDNFREYILNEIDDDGDGFLSDEEQIAISMDISDREISDLTGIQLFPSLRELRCNDNRLTSLDLSANTNIRILYCSNSMITDLDLSGCTKLETLYCAENPIQELSIADCSELKHLFCFECDFNKLDINSQYLADAFCYGDTGKYLLGEDTTYYFYDVNLVAVASLVLDNSVVLTWGSSNVHSPRPNDPNNLVASSVTSSSIHLTWGKVDNAYAYEVWICSAGRWDIYTSTEQTSCNVMQLEPNTDYCFDVRAYVEMAGGERLYSRFSEIIKATTLSSSVVPNPTIITPTSTPRPSSGEVTKTPTATPTTRPSSSIAPSSAPSKVPTVTGSPTATPTNKPTATMIPTQAVTTTPVNKPTSTPAQSSDESGISGFVERLYTVALGRPSDPYGKADWVNRVRSEGYTGADLARGFLFSDEFLGKNMSNSEFLDVLYETFFNRPADEHKADWLGLMDSGWTKTQVIDGFINSTEWANLCLTFGVASGSTFKPNITVEPSQGVIDFATRLYTTCLGREPDPAGLADWSSQLANMQISGSDAAHGFFTSAEFVNAGHSDAEYVTRLYRTFMGREPDEGGFNNWMAALASGQSREFVFQGFAGSAEWAGICADYGILR